MKTYFVYILSSRSRVLYIGMTNNLQERINAHKEKQDSNSFTARYNVDRLVYYEETNSVNTAIAREKELKGWRRERKIELIEAENHIWRDLSDDWLVG